MVYNSIALFWMLEFIIPAECPFPWVTDNTGTNHIQINIYQTSDQMRSRLNGSGMVSVFPESTFSFLPPVKFPYCPSCNELNRYRDDIFFSIVHQQVDMLCDCVVQNAEPKTFLGFKQPIPPLLFILVKFQKEFSLMASMGDVPDIPWNVVSIRTGHFF